MVILSILENMPLKGALIMSNGKIGPLNAENVKELNRRFKGNEVARQAASKEVRRQLPAFVEKTFDLKPEQRKNMHELLSKDVSESVGSAIAKAWDTGGDVQLIMEPQEGSHATMKVETLVTTNWSISITITVSC